MLLQMKDTSRSVVPLFDAALELYKLIYKHHHVYIYIYIDYINIYIYISGRCDTQQWTVCQYIYISIGTIVDLLINQLRQVWGITLFV